MVEDDSDLDELRALYAAVIERNEFYSWLDVEPIEIERGRVVGRVPFDPKLTTPRSIATNSLHGGVIATLVDLSAIAAVLTTQGPRTTVATTDLGVSFERPSRETVVAEAEVTDVADEEASASVVVREASAEGDAPPLATGDVTCKLN